MLHGEPGHSDMSIRISLRFRTPGMESEGTLERKSRRQPTYTAEHEQASGRPTCPEQPTSH